MSDQPEKMSGPGAGLSQTGRTADDFEPGEAGPGTTYGDPGGTATADAETTETEDPAES